MTHLTLSGFRAVFNLGQKLGLDPDAAMGNFLGIRLGPADQRLKFFAQGSGRCFIETVIDLAGVDESLALAAAKIDAVPLAFIESEAGDGQRLALLAGLLHPIVDAAR